MGQYSDTASKKKKKAYKEHARSKVQEAFPAALCAVVIMHPPS